MPKHEYDPEDPVELVGVELSGGDPEETLEGIVREYLMMGWKPRQILFLFQSNYYALTHQIYLRMGKEHVWNRIQQICEEWRKGWLVPSPAIGGTRDA